MLEPIVTSSQVSKVTTALSTVGYMNTDAAKLAFAERMNEICDEKKVPPKERGRQTKLAAIFKVTQKGARKWLEGEGYPTIEKAAEIAAWAGVTFEWLMTGRGDKYQTTKGDARENALLQLYRDSDPRGKDTIFRVAEQESNYKVSDGELPRKQHNRKG